MQHALSRAFAQLGAYENVAYELRDANGNAKPIFQEYRITQLLIKKGILNPLWINTAIGGVASRSWPSRS
jgi:hypothetical protein